MPPPDPGQIDAALAAGDAPAVVRLLRPLFAGLDNRSHAEVTPAGRRRLVPDDIRSSYDTDLVDVSARPAAVALLEHTVDKASAAQIAELWPFLVPSILLLLDSPDLATKTRGVAALRRVLLGARVQFLALTGLLPVFWDALMTTLAFLPTASSDISVEASVALLREAFPTLYLAADLRAVQGDARTDVRAAEVAANTSPAFRIERARLLDAVLSDGVYRGLDLVGDKVEVADVLVAQITVVASLQGVHSVRTLERNVRVLARVLADPFAPAYPPLMQTAAAALAAVIRNGWPRLAPYRYEILRAIASAWRRIHEDAGRPADGGALAPVAAALAAALGLLRTAVVAAGVDWPADAAALAGVPGLAGLCI
ncbi:uncharacterized protein V1510DRAFT_402693 [Dipodascopsis tothii]|uniref:uncharacterized protein n=1 Tax=Dipodascopsis tothii TaxID=44089 RepID=UPI0034D001FD